MKYEYEFKINQMFDRNNEYDLFICSVCFALSDLMILNQEMNRVVDIPGNNNSSFYFRINMGFAREAYELLKSKFTDNYFISKYFDSLNGAVDKYNEINEIIFGNTEFETFKEHKMNKNRHLIFHYPKQAEDYMLIHDVLTEIEKDGQDLKYYESDDTIDFERQKLDFAKTIQYNTLFGIHKISDVRQHARKLNDLAILTGKIINLLNLLFVDFVSRKR